MKVLIVEDNSLMRRELINIVKNNASEVYECDDGIYVESLYEKYKPDIIFMDIVMKQMNGLIATQKLIVKHPEAKVIIVTNFTEKKLKEKALEAGAKGFMLKDDLNKLKEFLIN